MAEHHAGLDPIVEFTTREPGLAARLLAEHVDDNTGHCRVCSAGAQTAPYVWPCQIYAYAASAAAVRRDATAPTR